MDRDLTLNFFIAFSAAECALKRSGYLRGSDGNWARPDWHRFADDIEPRFRSEKKGPVANAVAYLCAHPPNRQVVRGGSLSWESMDRGRSESSARYVLDVVKQVRNNLFHGGKYPGTPQEEPARNERLLEASLAVLRELVHLEPKMLRNLPQEFHEATASAMGT